MKARLLALALAGATLLAARSTSARDDRLTFSITNALSHVQAKRKLDPSVRLYFGKQPHPAVVADLGDDKANEKTRAFNRTDQEACDWVFLSAVLKLQERARRLQANAVVDIVSVYKNERFESDTEYRCGAGSMVAGVALTGRFVKLAQ
jgi:uncharacterized protein YbjQ (UPF0145 family)